jgi:branched-chain amino acid transport system ATP-binding protein
MLEVRNVVAGYGNMPVLHGLSLEAKAGEILLVGGENGAGKSTLMRTIGGFIRPTRGEILLDGRNIAGMAPESVARAGLRLVLDGHRIFPGLSVYDNLLLGAAARSGGAASLGRAVEQIYDVFPVLREKRGLYARDLSGGQQQMLALGQAFVAQPKVLLCDEPSLGLAQALLPAILAFLRRWSESGTAVVIVEQHLAAAVPYADRAIIMDRGMLRFACRADELEARLAVPQAADAG